MYRIEIIEVQRFRIFFFPFCYFRIKLIGNAHLIEHF